MSPASVSKVVSLDEAVALVQPGSTLATSGFVGIGTPDGLLEALARAYQAHGRPGGLTLVFAPARATGRRAGSIASPSRGSSSASWAATGD